MNGLPTTNQRKTLKFKVERLLVVAIKNRGEGPRIDVQLHLSADNPDIQFVKIQTLGKIESKGQRTVNVPITTNLQAASSRSMLSLR